MLERLFYGEYLTFVEIYCNHVDECFPGSSTIIESLFHYCRSGPSLAIAYFYFDFLEDARLHSILQSLIKQLSLHCETIPEGLEKLFSENMDGHRIPKPEELMATFRSIVKSFKDVYIIFDALDECRDRSEVLERLTEIHGWGLDMIHLLATSRKEQDIEETLSELVSHTVSMDSKLVDSDIRVHLSKTLEHDIQFRKWSVDEKKMIETTLIKGAHGM